MKSTVVRRPLSEICTDTKTFSSEEGWDELYSRSFSPGVVADTFMYTSEDGERLLFYYLSEAPILSIEEYPNEVTVSFASLAEAQVALNRGMRVSNVLSWGEYAERLRFVLRTLNCDPGKVWDIREAYDHLVQCGLLTVVSEKTGTPLYGTLVQPRSSVRSDLIMLRELGYFEAARYSHDPTYVSTGVTNLLLRNAPVAVKLDIKTGERTASWRPVVARAPERE